MTAPAALPRVVIIGCGFAGIEAVRALAKAEVEVTLIDRTNHHLFQPLLYQVATAGVSAPAISGPIRHILRSQMQRGRLTVLMAEVTAIDAAGRAVLLDDGERVGYDHLILAAGATHSYFGNDAWAAHAPGLKTLADALHIRRRVLLAFEHAEREADLREREACLTFAVVGAGPTGVEMAGQLAEIAHHTLPDEYRRIDSRRARVVLIEGGPKVLSSFSEKLSRKALDQLVGLGVEVLTQAKVSAIDAHGLNYETPDGATHRLDAQTVVWAAGVAASPLGRALAASTGCRLDRAGRVLVEPDLSLPGRPEISVVGDLASVSIKNRRGETQVVPGVSPAAKQMGRQVARNLLARLRGQPTQPFRYTDYGNLATIGRRAAIAAVDVPLFGKLQFSGMLAWLFWLFVHIYFLIGFRNRLVVLTDWAWAYFSFERQARVVAEPQTQAHS